MKRVVVREHGRLEPRDVHGGPHVGAAGEVEPGTVPRRVFDRLRRFDERMAKRDGAVFTWYAHHAKAAQWVGVVQVEGVQVEILPKIEASGDVDADRTNLLAMLALAGDVPMRSRELAALSTRRAGLGDALARLFGQSLRSELLRGPERAYIHRRENLTRFKGKLAIRPHLRQNAAHRERFVCEFDELVMDTDLNRVLKAASELLLGASRRPGTQDVLRHCLLLLDEVSSVQVTPELLGRISITRQNERFRALFDFCRMIFMGRTPTVRGGPTTTFSLLFDMNVVFERFVTTLVRRHVLPSMPGWKLFPQAKSRRRHLLRSQGRGVLSLSPDLLFERPDGSLLVMDTKWKRLVPGREVGSLSREDLYQLYAYSQRYEASRSVLLFPHVDGLRGQALEVLGQSRTESAADVEVAFLSLAGDLGRSSTREQAAGALRSLLSVVPPS